MTCLANISYDWCGSLCWSSRCSVCLESTFEIVIWVGIAGSQICEKLLALKAGFHGEVHLIQADITHFRRQDPHTTTWRMQAVRFCWDAPLSRHCCPKGTISSHLWLQMPRNNLTSARLTGLRPLLPLIERELLVAEKVIRRECILCWPAHIRQPFLQWPQPQICGPQLAVPGILMYMCLLAIDISLAWPPVLSSKIVVEVTSVWVIS